MVSILFAELLQPNSVTMSNGERPSNNESGKKRKADDTDGFEDDIDCGTEGFGSSHWICEDFPITEYLTRYKPETKVNKVESFLVLGELCQNLRIYTSLIQKNGKSYLIENDYFDFKVFKTFRAKLKIIQAMCLKKARESLEKWQRDGNANLVFNDLFLGNWKEAESIGRLEKHEGEDKENLNKTYAKLAPIYVSLRDIEHGAYCDQHPKYRGGMIEPFEGEVTKINKIMNEFQLD